MAKKYQIKQARVRSNLLKIMVLGNVSSHSEFGRLLGLPRDAICKTINHKRQVCVQMLIGMEQLWGVTAYMLFETDIEALPKVEFAKDLLDYSERYIPDNKEKQWTTASDTSTYSTLQKVDG